MTQSLAALEKQYFFLSSSLSDQLDNGATPEELDATRSAIVQSRMNYWKVIHAILNDDDPAVLKLISQMNAAQLNLEAGMKHLGQVAKVLDVIATAVEVGSQLAAKAVSL